MSGLVQRGVSNFFGGVLQILGGLQIFGGGVSKFSGGGGSPNFPGGRVSIGIRSTFGRYASYWNAFLFEAIISPIFFFHYNQQTQFTLKSIQLS